MEQDSDRDDAQACMEIAEQVLLSNLMPRDDIRVLYGDEPLILLPYGMKVVDGCVMQVITRLYTYLFAYSPIKDDV